MSKSSKKNVLGSEAELAKLVIDWFRVQHWEIYQEVPFNGIAADIVVTKGPVVGVVECKKYLNLEVLEQCDRWVPHANFVWAAVWQPKRGANRFASKVCGDNGFGLINVSGNSIDYVYQRKKALFRRNTTGLLKDRLRPEMKTGEFGKAGTNRGGRFTPFRETCEQLSSVVLQNPGIELKAAIKLIKKHHYASDAAARVNLKKYIENGVISGLTSKIDSGKIKLYVAKNSPMIN